MQKFSVIGAIVAMTMAAGGSAWGQGAGDFRAAARLAKPAAAPSEAVIAGVAWRCGAAGCVGVAERYNTLDSVLRECRRVAAVVGPVTAYASRGERLGRSGVAACNRGAARAQLAAR